jgi:outer membrane protein OmpA-like peptidoglycan-associated protein
MRRDGADVKKRGGLGRAPLAGAAAAALLSLSPSPVGAQTVTATALDRLEPSPAGDGLLSVPDAIVAGELRPTAGVVLSYADAPFVIFRSDGVTLAKDREVVANQLVLHTLLGLEVARRLKIEVDVPMTLVQGAGPEAPPDSSYPSLGDEPAKPLNDIRTGARVELVRQRGYVPAAALAFSLWIPSGDEARYTGAAGFRYAPALVVGASTARLVWSAAVSGRFQDGQDGLFGSEMLLGAGAAMRFGRLQVGPEIFGSTVVSGEDQAFSAKSTNLEWLLGARLRVASFVLGAGGGSGLTRGIGTPRFRLLANVAFAFEAASRAPAPEPAAPAPEPAAAERAPAPEKRASAPEKRASRESRDWPAWPDVDTPRPRPPSSSPPPDADRDGVPDAEDTCPTKPGLKTSERRRGCPADGDGDGIADAEDACRDRVGVASSDPKRRGCPPDRDADGAADTDDLCPDESNTKAPDPARRGCLVDTDGDGIVDPSDACPDVKGPASSDPQKNGCSNLIALKPGENIILKQKIKFTFGGDVISPESFPLLTEIANLMKEHPEIGRVSVDGHTDNTGSLPDNISLSQRRSLSVVRWLLDHGIDARRLETRGFGPKQPLGNDPAENRRVEFTIRMTTNLGEAGWREGRVDEPGAPVGGGS